MGFLIYLIFVSEKLSEFMGGFLFNLSAFLFFVFLTGWAFNSFAKMYVALDKTKNKGFFEIVHTNLNKFKKVWIFFLILTVGVKAFSILIPSPKQVAVIWLVPAIARNEQVQEIPDNFFKLLNSGLQSLDELISADKAKEAVEEVKEEVVNGVKEEVQKQVDKI